MVSRYTTLVPFLGLRFGPACEVGLSAGMRRERMPSHKKERKIERTKKDKQRDTPTDVEFYLYPTVNTALIHLVKPGLTR